MERGEVKQFGCVVVTCTTIGYEFMLVPGSEPTPAEHLADLTAAFESIYKGGA